MKKLTQMQKDRIVRLFWEGESSRYIARNVLKSETRKSTVNDFLAKHDWRAIDAIVPTHKDITSPPKVVKPVEVKVAKVVTSPRRELEKLVLLDTLASEYSLKLREAYYSNEHVEDNTCILNISDLHIPYHHPDAIEFLQHLKDKYKPTRVISLGDECFPPQVEVLTEKGYVSFEHLKDEKVAQWEDGKITFVMPERKIVKDFNGELLEYRHRSMLSITTPNHNLIKIHPVTGVTHKREAWDKGGTEQWEIPRKGYQDGLGIPLSDDEIRLMVAFQADGCFTKGGARFMFTKKRKTERLLELFDKTGVKFNTHDISNGDQFYIEKSNVPAYFTKLFNIAPYMYSSHQKEIFMRELGYWDGTTVDGGVRYVSIIKENVDYVSQICVLANYVPSRIKPANGQFSAWMLDVRWSRRKCTLKSATQKSFKYVGKVYCVTVPSGAIVVRTEGHVHVSGNCDKNALSYHEKDPELMSAGDEIKASIPVIAQLFKMFPDMDILDSNHGSLMYRKAKTAGIPKHYLKSYNDVLGVDSGWKWWYDLTIKLPNGEKCYYHHGKASDVKRLSQAMGMSAVQGHYHNGFKIDYWANPNGLYFGVQSGCLINDKALAFSYNNVNVHRPMIGTSLIVNSLPVLEPMVLDDDGRWVHRKNK